MTTPKQPENPPKTTTNPPSPDPVTPTPRTAELRERFRAKYPGLLNVFPVEAVQWALDCHEQLERELSAATAELARVREECDDANQRALSAEFWQQHAQKTNAEFEADYLEIWSAIKLPDKTVLESALELKSHLARLRAEVEELRKDKAKPICCDVFVEIAAEAIWRQHQNKLDLLEQTAWENAAPQSHGLTRAYAKSALLAIDAARAALDGKDA